MTHPDRLDTTAVEHLRRVRDCLAQLGQRPARADREQRFRRSPG
jgi:hypothetical protein